MRNVLALLLKPAMDVCRNTNLLAGMWTYGETMAELDDAGRFMPFY
jgi:hypothetical protein